LAKDYGAEAKQHTRVEKICSSKLDDDSTIWEVHALRHDKDKIVYKTRKIIIASGAYVNHVLKSSFGISLKICIWEMVASYFNCNAGPDGTIFPSKYLHLHPKLTLKHPMTNTPTPLNLL